MRSIYVIKVTNFPRIGLFKQKTPTLLSTGAVIVLTYLIPSNAIIINTGARNKL